MAHIDENPYYGGQEASLSLDEFIQWADTSNSSTFTSIVRSPHALPQSRQYSICLCPSFIPSIGPIISSLISSGVAKYGGFRLLERVGVYDQSGIIKLVPGTKEDVFKNKDINLIDKRRFMRFLMFSVSEFEGNKELESRYHLPFEEFLKTVFFLNDEMTATIIYSIAYCLSPSEPTLPVLHRIRRYLRSAGRYGASAFLVGHYGGTGDIAQGFCRAAAVSGGVYILGRRINSIMHTTSSFAADSPPSPRYSIELADFPEPLTCNVLISSACLVPQNLVQDAKQLSSTINDSTMDNKTSMVRCVAIVDHPIYFPPSTSSDTSRGYFQSGAAEGEAEPSLSSPQENPLPVPHPLDTGVLVFPPSSVPGGSTTMAATLLVTGEGSMSTPSGKWILYISLPLLPSTSSTSPQSPQRILQPYLDATLALMVLPSTPATPSTAPPPQNSIPEPLFTTFYVHHPDPPTATAPESVTELAANRKPYIIPPPLSPVLPLPDIPDAAAMHAETVFWEAVKTLRGAGDHRIESFWPRMDVEEESEDEE